MKINPELCEPNATPEGRLAEYLIGDLAPGRRMIRRLLDGGQSVSLSVLCGIAESMERCANRIQRDLPESQPADTDAKAQ